MSKAPQSARSFATIETGDLLRLGRIAQARIDAAFAQNPVKRAAYGDRLLAACLCQGAADHFINPGAGRGVHDFDVWFFFRRRAETGLWNRKPFTADLGPSKFGRSGLDPARYAGRRVDVLWRGIETEGAEDPAQAIRRYLAQPRTASARALRLKAAVMLSPSVRVGEIVWRP